MNQRALAGAAPAQPLQKIARALPGNSHVLGDSTVAVTGVRHDSRFIERGDLFAVRRGARVDGATFAQDAVSRGAAALLVQRGSEGSLSELGVPLIVADDASTALAYAANAVYGDASRALSVIGITGTNGKTTTAHLIRAALDGAFGRPACGVVGTVGHAYDSWSQVAEHTTPEADDLARVLARMRGLGATHVAMEVSSHALALGRVAALRFAGAAFTNLTHDHLDFHHSMAAYGEAKATLFTTLSPGFAVIHVGDAFGRDLAQVARAPVLRVRGALSASGSLAESERADIAPRRVTLSARGVDVTFMTPRGDLRIASPLVGAHNVENLAVALGVAFALGLDLAPVAEALSQAPCPPGRLERCDESGDDLVVLVDYAHTPDALTRALTAVRTGDCARVHCVFGCGGDRDPRKRAAMGAVAAALADSVIVTTDNPRSEDPAAIAAEVARGVFEVGGAARVILDREAAIAAAICAAAPQDVVLIAGKGHENYQIVGATRFPFDDRVAARLALADRRSRSRDKNRDR